MAQRKGVAEFVGGDARDGLAHATFHHAQTGHIFHKHSITADVNAISEEAFDVIDVKTVVLPAVLGTDGEQPAELPRFIVLSIGVGVGGRLCEDRLQGKVHAGVAPNAVDFFKYAVEVLFLQRGGQV